MSDDRRDNSGALFKNDRKQKPTHPDYNGKATVDGSEFYISAWIKEGKKGKFMSLAFKPVEQSKPREQTNSITLDDDGEIPF